MESYACNHYPASDSIKWRIKALKETPLPELKVQSLEVTEFLPFYKTYCFTLLKEHFRCILEQKTVHSTLWSLKDFACVLPLSLSTVSADSTGNIMQT